MSLKKRTTKDDNKEMQEKHSAGTGAPTMLTKEPSTTLLVDEKKDAKWKGWWQRFWTTWAMLGGFVVIVLLGHPALVIFVFFLQTMMFKEIKRLANVLSQDQDKPPVRPLQWYWFFTAVFFTYGQVLKQYFGVHVPYHSFISFGMWSMGIVTFVLSLRKNHFRYQFEVFAWVHLALLIVVVQSTFLIVNMFQGLIWFILPALLIVSNDTWAYFFGFFFGRTPLIAISPKKTWEGFSGAALMTLFTGFMLARFLSQFEFLVCPQTTFTFGQPQCNISELKVYTGMPHALPPYALKLAHALGFEWDYILISSMQIHGVILALFSSFIAPFGGFFASGFKRAFNIKDFGASIPGHGGVTDRMDCQIMMGLFTFVYYSNFVRSPAVSAAAILHAFHLLNPQDQQQVYQQIQQTQQHK